MAQTQNAPSPAAAKRVDAGAGRAQSAAEALKAAAEALGMIRGPQRVNALDTMEFWAIGSGYVFGQAFKPDGPWPEFKLTNYHVSMSFSLPAMRVDMTRTNPDGLVQGGGGLPFSAPQHLIQVVSGKFAWNESVPGGGFLPNSTATPAPDAVNDRLLQFWTATPFGAIDAAMHAGAAAQLAVEGGAQVVTFPLEETKVRIVLNAKNLVDRVEVLSDNPVLGDTIMETAFSDYKDLGEISSDTQFPAHIVEKQGGYPVLDLTVTKDDPNNPYVVFPVPDGVQKAAPPDAGVKVDAQRVGEGVWYLTGGTHHSVAIEFKDYVALVECPLGDERAQAVIDTVKKTIPNKPIRYAINTHNHFDHLGGLRGCAAEGATILTQADNKPYYEKIWALPHNIKPDHLAESRKKPVIEGVVDRRVLTDGAQTLELYRLQRNNHAQTMLIGYVPKAKLLIEADVYTPGAPNVPPGPASKESVNLLDQIKRLNLDVQQITPLHGRLVTIGDLRSAAGEASGN